MSGSDGFGAGVGFDLQDVITTQLEHVIIAIENKGSNIFFMSTKLYKKKRSGSCNLLYFFIFY
jgi:hypothetical protein